MPVLTRCLLALILSNVAVSSVTPEAFAQGQSAPTKRPTRSRRVLYNFDGDSCLSTKAGSKGPVAVDVDDVKQLIQEVAYVGSRVDTVLVCVNAQVMYYPTTVGTMRGTLSTPDERADWPASEKQRFENLKAFFDADIDPYAVMLAEARKRGCEALLTFRMNDDHGNDFLRTQFLVDHPEWSLGTKQYQGKGAMDFARDDVRDYTFRLIEEAVRRYDCDGIELDFNRFPRFFKDRSVDEHVAMMNTLVERVRGMLDEVGRERGRHLVLAVRVPSNFGRTPPTPETARLLGCDVRAWVSHGWVDFVAVSEFLFERGNLPIDKWKEVITTVPVYGGIECTKGGGAKNLSADEYRHAADRLIKAGSDGVYLFNFFTSREGGAAAYEPPFEVLSDLAVSQNEDQTSADNNHDAHGEAKASRTINVFLLAGQSNMAGADSEIIEPPGFQQTAADRATRFTTAPLPDGEDSEQYVPWGDIRGHLAKNRLVQGPEVGFARSLYAAGWRDVAIIKVYANFSRDVTSWPWSDGGKLFETWTTFVDARLTELRHQGHTFRVCGFVWHQGIDDAIHGTLAHAYEQNLSDLIEVLHNRYATKQTPFVLARSVMSRIAQREPDPKQQSPMAVVRRAQMQIGATLPAVAWINVDDLPNVNTHHFDADGQLVIGGRFAKAFLTLQQKVDARILSDHD
jgi:hypothetical protein